MAILKKVFHFGNSLVNNVPSIFSRNTLVNYQPCANINIRKIEERLGLPPRPKKPYTPYIKFVQNHWNEIIKEHPNLSAPEIIKILSGQWKTCDNDEKQNMKNIYNNELENYTNATIEYEKNLTDEQKESIKNERLKLINKKEKYKKKLRMENLGRPKKPPTPFVLYMLAKLNKRGQENFSDWLIKLGKEWHNLSAEDRLLYQNECAELVKEYKKEMMMWESKMIEMGYLDLIRRNVLVELKGKTDTAGDN